MALKDSWFQRIIVGLFHFLVIAVPFFFTWVNEELFEFPKMLLTYAIALSILGFWVGRMILTKSVIFRRTILDIPILLFVISQILSTLFSIHPYTSFFGYYTRFHGGLLSTLTYVLLFYAFISNVSRKQLSAFFYSVLVAAIGVSLYAIPEHFGYSPSCFLINQNHAFDVSCWIQDVKNRIFGTFGQPNWLAAYAITLIPWALGIVGWTKKNTLKITAAVTLVLLFITLLYTQSRSGLLGLVIGLGAFGSGGVWLIIQQLKRHSFSAHKQVYAWFAGLAVLCLVIFLFSGDSLIKNLAQTAGFSSVQPSPVVTDAQSPSPMPINRLEVNITDSADIRKIVWEGAFDVWRRYPLLGSGVETFAYSYYQDRPVEHNLVSEWDFLYNKAHNEFLNFLATTGILGAATYTILVASLVTFCLYYFVKVREPGQKWLLLGSASGIVALTFSNLLGFSTVMVTILFFLLPAILIVVLNDEYPAVGRWLTKHFGQKTKETESVQTSQLLLLGTIGLLWLYGLFMIYTIWQADHNYATGKQYFGAGYYAEGITLLQTAIAQAPQEALYYDELGTSYAQLAGGFAQQGDATTAAQLSEAAILSSNKTLELNSRHLNFHKSRARVFINLSVIDEAYLSEAKTTLEYALTLSPTDAKLMYNLALVEDAMGQTDAAIARLEETVAIKSNYESARADLARLYRQVGQYDLARNQYQYILTNITPDNDAIKEQLTDLDLWLATQSATRK